MCLAVLLEVKSGLRNIRCVIGTARQAHKSGRLLRNYLLYVRKHSEALLRPSEFLVMPGAVDGTLGSESAQMLVPMVPTSYRWQPNNLNKTPL